MERAGVFGPGSLLSTVFAEFGRNLPVPAATNRYRSDAPATISA